MLYACIEEIQNMHLNFKLLPRSALTQVIQIISYKIQNLPIYIVITMAVEELIMQRAKASAAMILSKLFCKFKIYIFMV